MSLALAIASLALPSGPTYDPYAWLIWGRDIVHFHLVTTGDGTSWKPLPAFVDAALTPLGGGAASGWLVVARAGAMFAVFMAFRLAFRLAPAQRWLAGVCAAACVVLTRDWLVRNGVGDAEGLMAAFGLLAIDRHLDGRRGQALALIVAASLIRVEAWPFAMAYAMWTWWRREHRAAAVFGLGLIPLCWFGGDWIGSGNLGTAAGQALHKVPGSPGASAHPAIAVFGEALGMLPPVAWVAIAMAVGAAAAAGRTAGASDRRRRGASDRRRRGASDRRRRGASDRRPLALAGFAFAWTAIVAAMAQRGYAGLPRFLFMATALEAVLVGIGCAIAADAVAAWSARRTSSRLSPAGALGALAVALAFAAGSIPNAIRLPRDASSIDKVADMDSRLADRVDDAGGAAAVLRCGAPSTTWYTVTALAYDLGVPPGEVHSGSTNVRLPAPPCRASADSTTHDRS